MGMAASQARYLGLTARKTNVEYEGQQINQARTALANQSANTFNELLALEVPTAPSTQDYTTTQYSYEDGTVAETITSMTPLENDPDGYNYLVTHYHYSDVFTGIENIKRNPQVLVSDRIEKNEIDENKVETTTDPATGETIYSVRGYQCSAYDQDDAEQSELFDTLSASYADLREADLDNVMTYKDSGGKMHIVLQDQLDSAASGEAAASDYYMSGTRAAVMEIPANTIAAVTDPETGAASYTVNGNQCTKYDENDAAMKEAYDKAVAENPTLAKIDTDQLYTYTDSDAGVHFISASDIEGVMTGAAAASDYSVASGVPTMLGNIELSVYDPTDKEQLEEYEQILEDWPESTFATSESTIYTWEDGGQRYFACYEDLMASWNGAPDASMPSENQPALKYYAAQAISTKIEQTERAVIDFDDKGRAESIRYENSSAVRALNTETITDEAAYNDAMNQYYYDQQVYEKKIEDINAKTKKIQEQDRTLELRLRQLDTEQEALQTEMEAVAKVIEKNIESTFKTFE